MDKDGVPHCYYCDIPETESMQAFENKLLSTKKTAWKKGSMQIDRKDSEAPYDTKNCVFACVLCNNAKSDMISAEDFKKYFGEATKKFWGNLK